MGLRRERTQDRVAEIDHDHPGLIDGEVVELRRQHVAHQVGDRPRHLGAGGAGPDDHDVERALVDE